MEEIFRLIDFAIRAFESTATWDDKYHYIFRLGIVERIKTTRFDFDYYDPDTTYEADVIAFVVALVGFRERMRPLYPELK